MEKTTKQLKSWLFGKPVLFSLVSFLSVIVFVLMYSLVGSFIHFDMGYDSLAALFLFILPFIYPVYYLIKKLSVDKMYRNDFIAIVNGCAIISLLFSAFTIPYFTHIEELRRYMLKMYVLHPAIFNTAAFLLIFVALYLIGVSIANIYAKYKRCTTMGINKWKVILSMPFAFFMLWTPGYLIEEKTKKSNLEIKSVWFSKFQKWVVSGFNNTLLVFLFLLLLKSVFAGILTITLSVAILVIYTLWYVKHKSDFIKNINNGYALTAVGINLAVIIAMLVQHL